MKTMKSAVSLLLVACALLCVTGAAAFATVAREAPDLDATGSICLTMTYGGTAVPGGAVAAYRVGEVAEDDGAYGFALSREFAESGANLDDPSSAELAQALADYADEQDLAGTGASIEDDGTAKFSDVKPGLYLIVQTAAAEGYEAVAPFLVSVPANEGGAYVYDVDATPKMEPLAERPQEPQTPAPSAPSDPTLPQTGQLNWPVPVMTVLGLCLLVFGWALRYGKSREPHEA